jgi:hypothetical protein
MLPVWQLKTSNISLALFTRHVSRVLMIIGHNHELRRQVDPANPLMNFGQYITAQLNQAQTNTPKTRRDDLLCALYCPAPRLPQRTPVITLHDPRMSRRAPECFHTPCAEQERPHMFTACPGVVRDCVCGGGVVCLCVMT